MKEEALKLADELDALHQYVPSEAPAMIRRLVEELDCSESYIKQYQLERKPTITKLDGKVVAVTMTDDEHRITEVLWEAPKPLSDGCGNCHACLVGVMENNMPVTSQRMIVCSDCGNKRCPKASNHRHKCTGSNEVGQYGSIYTAPRELSDEELNKAFDYYCETDEGVLRFNYELRDEWKKEQLSRWKESFKKAREK